MIQEKMFDDDIYDCLRADIHVLGGNKFVGYKLRPDKNPQKAGEWVSQCLAYDRRETFRPDDVQKIIQMAHEKGSYITITHVCKGFFEPLKPLNNQEKKTELLKTIEKQQAQLLESLNELNGIGSVINQTQLDEVIDA